jgi:hypothetical protein
MARVILNLIATLIALVAVMSADAPAQQPSTGSQQQPSTGSQQPPEEQRDRTPARGAKDATITVVGCVRSAAAPGGFILANTDPVADARATPTPAPESTRAGVDTGSSYTLVAISGEDLTRHLNHKVEVIGVLGPPVPPSPDGPATKPLVEPVGTITVQSLKMVSASCP